MLTKDIVKKLNLVKADTKADTKKNHPVGTILKDGTDLLLNTGTVIVKLI